MQRERSEEIEVLLDRTETVEETMRAHEAVEAIRTAADGYLATTPYSYRRVGARHQREEDFQ